MVDQIAVVTDTTRATPGLQSFTHPSITEPFSAAILIFSGATTDSADNTHAQLGIGFVTPLNTGNSEEEQAMVATARDGNAGSVPTAKTRHSVSQCVLVHLETDTAAPTIEVAAVFNASVAGGVELSFTTTTRQVKVTVILFAGLTRAVAEQFTATTIGNAIGIGGTVDFEPDLVLFATSQAAVNNDVNDGSPNLGFALNKSGLPQVMSYLRWDNATAVASDSDGFFRSADCCGHFESGATERHGRVTAFTATGMTLTSDGGSPDGHYIALKFSGAFRMACANMAVAASVGDQSFNDFGFTPDLVVGMSHRLPTVDATTDGDLASSCGLFVTGRYASRAYTACFQDGILTANAKVARTRQEDVAVLTYDNTGAVTHRATWEGATGSGGFKLNFSVADTAGVMTALGIQLIPNPPLPIRRARQQRKPRTRRQVRQLIVQGRPPGQPPLMRSLFWRAIWRIRKAMQLRLRRPVLPTGERTVFIGAAAEESTHGRVFSPGMVRGKITGAGVLPPEPE